MIPPLLPPRLELLKTNPRLSLVALLVIVLVAVLALAACGDPIDATVRLSAGGTLGTGTVFRDDEEGVWILTCRQVVGSNRTMQVDLWRNGWQATTQVTGQVRSVGTQTDSAVVFVPASALGDYRPPVIPFATRRGQVGDTILSVGCPNGTWPTMFRGHLIKSDLPGCLSFVPPPAGGRSGSGILKEDGAAILGVLHSRRGDDTVGYADPIDRVMSDLGVLERTEKIYVGLDTSGWRASTRRTTRW